MRKIINYALLGFGGIARNRIAKEGFGLGTGFTPPINAKLVAAFDIDPSGRKTAETWGLKWHNSAEAILNDPGIDAVFIASINSSHAPLAKLALMSGKHCIIEKPMATKLEDARELVKLAGERALSLSIDHMMTKNALNIKARELAASGELGTLCGICLHMESLYGSTPAEAASWRCSRPEELGGPVGDIASHCLYMAEFLLKTKVTALSAVYTPKAQEMKVESGALIRFETEQGITGGARVSFAENRGGLTGGLTNLGFEIYGERGVLRSFGTLFQLSGNKGEPIRQRLELETDSALQKITPTMVRNIYGAVIEEHARSILDGQPMSGEDGLWNLRLILSVHESAAGGGIRVAF